MGSFVPFGLSPTRTNAGEAAAADGVATLGDAAAVPSRRRESGPFGFGLLVFRVARLAAATSDCGGASTSATFFDGTTKN
jgi:hypothetical protein